MDFWRGDPRISRSDLEDEEKIWKHRNTYLTGFFRPEFQTELEIMLPEWKENLPKDLVGYHWQKAYLNNVRMLKLWNKGRLMELSKKLRVLVVGPRGSGKTSLLRGISQIFGQDRKAKEEALATAYSSDLENCSMTSIQLGETEVIFVEMEIGFGWQPNYRGPPVDCLVYCLDGAKLDDLNEEIATAKIYDHLHGMLGEAFAASLHVMALVTKLGPKGLSQEMKEKIDDTLTITALGTCGWYSNCTSRIVGCSSESAQGLKEFMRVIKSALNHHGKPSSSSFDHLYW